MTEHYNCCWVFLQKDEPDAFKELGTGNRIATWLFYVSKFFLNTSDECIVCQPGATWWGN